MKLINVGIFAHIDAGKTTLAERLLLEAGAVRKAGSVDGGTSTTDFLPVERRRGISVRDATVTFPYRDAVIGLIDTPGHADFFEETELALPAVDLAVVVLSAREGVQAQTEGLLEAIGRRNLPAIFFLNKCDLDGAMPREVISALRRAFPRELLPLSDGDAAENAVGALGDEELLDRFLGGTLPKEELDRRLTEACTAGNVCPLLCGSAKTGEGVRELLDTIVSLYDFPQAETAPFSAFVYQVEHRKTLGKVAHVRVYGGKIGGREEILNRRTQSSFKAAQIKKIRGEKYDDVSCLSAGEVGAIAGLTDVRAGDFLGAPPPVAPLPPFTPYFRVRVAPSDESELPALRSALGQLSDESPSLSLEWVPEKRELTVSVSGKVQAEVLQETLAERFSLSTELGAPSVVYRETPARPAYGYEAYTMPKPCWAVVKFLIEPLPRGSGFVYESVVSEKKIAYRYQEHVKTEVPRALTQGLKGWQVTDLKVTLVDGEHHVLHTHPLDFFVATPMGIMDGLRNAGTILLEPVLLARIRAEEGALGKILAELSARRAVFDRPLIAEGKFTLEARIPAEETFDLPDRIASLTGGRGTYDTRLLGYFPCPEGKGAVRERVGIDPLDRAKWILHARGAYKC